MRASLLSLVLAVSGHAASIDASVKHGYADSNGVRIHYASLGSGPLLVMIHGYPDFWYTWRDQMAALSDTYQCVAIDQRGYNLSDKPKGAENYDLKLLAGDVAAVIRSLGRDKAIVMGHDWGAMTAWTFAMTYPQMTDKLIILSVPNPRGLKRELAHNPEQQKSSQYVRDIQQSADAASRLTTEQLVRLRRITDLEVRAKYVEAFQRSDFEGMLNYYRVNYPHEPYAEDTSPVVKVQAPVLEFQGLKDKAVLPGALNDSWEWLDKDLTLVTIPSAGHWLQQDASELVTRTIRFWLSMR